MTLIWLTSESVRWKTFIVSVDDLLVTHDNELPSHAGHQESRLVFHDGLQFVPTRPHIWPPHATKCTRCVSTEWKNKGAMDWTNLRNSAQFQKFNFVIWNATYFIPLGERCQRVETRHYQLQRNYSCHWQNHAARKRLLNNRIIATI